MTPEQLEERLQQAFEQVQPQLLADGIQAECVEVRGAIMFVKLNGICLTCSRQQMAQRLYIEAAIRRLVPELGAVWPATAEYRAPI